MRNRTLCLLAVPVLAVACGGKVEPGTSSSGGTSNGGTSNGGTSNGGTSNGGTSNGGTSNGGTGGSPAVTCSGPQDCCVKACTLLTQSVHCPATPADCSCSAITSLPGNCDTALADAYRCLLKVGPQAVKCDQSGNLAIRCGFCESELQALSQACSGQAKCVH